MTRSDFATVDIPPTASADCAPQEGRAEDTPQFWHRVTEAFKWSYAQRSRMGDPAGNVTLQREVAALLANLTR